MFLEINNDIAGKPRIGIIGKNWVGNSYYDDFKRRGFELVFTETNGRNSKGISLCDIVFICLVVDCDNNCLIEISEAIRLVGDGKIAVIRSTILPGMTEIIQGNHPDVFVMHSPEFLNRKSASDNAAFPEQNIIGIPRFDGLSRRKAQSVMNILPKAKRELICRSRESELIKFGSNAFFFFKTIYANLLFELAENLGIRWDMIKAGVSGDERVGNSYMMPVYEGSRGIRGDLKKNFECLKKLYSEISDDKAGLAVFDSLESKNSHLLKNQNQIHDKSF